MAEDDSARARYPSLTERSLVYWTGDKGGHVLPLIDTGTTSAIALSLANATRNRALIEGAPRRSLGVMLDGEAWRGQLDPEHRMRKSWAPPGLREDEIVYPDAAVFGDEWRQALTEAFIEAQVAAEGTILTTPEYVSIDPLGVARQNGLALAADAIEHVKRRRLREPGPGTPHAQPRVLFATLAVQPSTLTEEAVRQLVAAYSHLEVDGFIVWAVKCGNSKRQFLLMRQLAIELQKASQKPVVLGGLGQLWKLALASGVAAACFGHQRSQLAWPPEEMKPPKPGEKPKGRGVAVYHQDILGGFMIGEPGAKHRASTFAASPCSCDHHAAAEAPATSSAALAHNASMTMVEARAAVAGTPIDAVTRMLARAASAARRRAHLGMGRLSPAWRITIAEAFPDLIEPGEQQTG
jgi:hypothetical protein